LWGRTPEAALVKDEAEYVSRETHSGLRVHAILQEVLVPHLMGVILKIVDEGQGGVSW
jgi:hypothetical protein